MWQEVDQHKLHCIYAALAPLHKCCKWFWQTLICVASVCHSQHGHATVWHLLSFTKLQRLACISVKAEAAFLRKYIYTFWYLRCRESLSVTTAIVDICIIACRVKAHILNVQLHSSLVMNLYFLTVSDIES